MTDLDRLDALAAAVEADQLPVGGWRAVMDEDGYWNVFAAGDGVSTALHNSIAYGPAESVARYIAACDPATIRYLVAAARRGSHPMTAPDPAGLREVDVIASLHAANHDSGWTTKDWNLFVNACAALNWKALRARLVSDGAVISGRDCRPPPQGEGMTDTDRLDAKDARRG